MPSSSRSTPSNRSRGSSIQTDFRQILRLLVGALSAVLQGAPVMTIEQGLTYEKLLADTIDISIDGRSIRVLSLATYVELKEESEQPRDRARLPILRETLQMQQNNGQ